MGQSQAPAKSTSASAVPPPATALIEGTVTRAADGRPLKRARISLRPQAEGRPTARPRTYQASTDANGKFSISDISPGRYRLSVDRPGYVHSEYGQRQPGRPGANVSLDAGQKMRELVFRLLDDAVITGRVTDEDGEPVISGNVQTLRLSYQRGQKQFFPAGNGQTNDRGEYRIFGLAPGRYYVSAAASPQNGGPGNPRQLRELRAADGTEEPDEVYAPTFYPGTTDPQNAAPLQVAPGQEITGIDLSIAPQRAVRVRGRITAPPQAVDADPSQNRRRFGIQATLLRKGAAGAFSRAFAQQADVDQDQGTFEFRAVLPGSYLIMAFTSDGRRGITHRESVEVGRSDVDGVNIVMSSGAELNGKIRVEGNAGINPQSIRLQLLPAEDSFVGGVAAMVTPEGTFTFQGISVTDKHYLTVLGLPPNFYVKSARIGGEDVTESGIQMPGKAGGTLDVVMSGNGGVIDGTVLDAESLPASAVTVVLVPAVKRRGNPTYYRAATTDSLGKFSMQGIPPGEYKLFSWDDVDPGAWQDPEFLAPYEERGLRVSVAEGATVPAEVRLLVNR